MPWPHRFAETAIWPTEVAPENRIYYAGGRKINEPNDRLNPLMPSNRMLALRMQVGFAIYGSEMPKR
jgi:hypothetical protein